MKAYAKGGAVDATLTVLAALQTLERALGWHPEQRKAFRLAGRISMAKQGAERAIREWRSPAVRGEVRSLLGALCAAMARAGI